MPLRHMSLVAALVAIVALAAVPAHAVKSPYGEMGVFAGEFTTAGDWTGTWMYVWRDGRMALWIRPAKDGKPEIRLQYQSTSNPETFETDWTGKSTYYLSGQAATFALRLTKRDKDELTGRWDWNVDFVDSGRTETGDVRIYRVGDGRMIAFEFQPGYLKTIRRGERVSRYEVAPVFNFVKASRRIVLWDELPLVIRGCVARRARPLLGLVVAIAATGATPGPAGDTPVVDAPPRFASRLVKLGGALTNPAVRAHATWSEAAGFNGFFVYASETGGWSRRDAPYRPFLRRDFVKFARDAAARGIRVVVSVNPVADSGGTFLFSDPSSERRLTRFLDLLRRKAGVREFVVSFDDQPPRLTALEDLLQYGAVAAPAHIDLVRRVAAGVRPDVRLWMCGVAYCDRHLDGGPQSYGAAFLEGLKNLPQGVGIVWTGPEVISKEITTEGLRAARARLGGREILLYDNYPVNDDPGDALGLVLGPLRKRDASLAAVASAYLACPMTQLAASRLPLATTAAWLADPAAYDPAAAWQRAIRDLAGPDPEVRDALETQALEWGGWIGETTWRHHTQANPVAAARALDDPAAVDRWTWTVERYPARLAAVARVEDKAFRDDVVRMMKRRLIVARAVPLAVEYLERAHAGRSDAAAILPALDTVRADPLFNADSRRILDLFLDAAGIPRHPH